MTTTTTYALMLAAQRAGNHGRARRLAETLVCLMQQGQQPPDGLTRHQAHRKAYSVIREGLAEKTADVFDANLVYQTEATY